MSRLLTAALVATGFVACSGPSLVPRDVDPRNDICQSCRMPVSDPRLAAQLLESGEEPRYFDDIGCLREDLAARPPRKRAALFVADHRTGAWIPAGKAVYSVCPSVATPMGSHLLAYADASSRDRDPAAKGGRPVTMEQALGPSARASGGSAP